ncbi:hypothetical protein, partial [Corynebacterium belfantii]|uniref:hypothetical protein n=1 Tax=Corynebacterium belfantii TaxID=2014537 RepID=UPI001A7E4BAD
GCGSARLFEQRSHPTPSGPGGYSVTYSTAYRHPHRYPLSQTNPITLLAVPLEGTQDSYP